MDYSGRIITKTAVTPSQTSAPGVWTLQDQILAQQSNTWPVPGVYNPISRSLRFNSADSAYLNWTFNTPTNNKIWTFSFWVKRSVLSVEQAILNANSVNAQFYFSSTNTLNFADVTSGATYYSSQVFRDVGAWYHIVIAQDTTQATAGNRVKIYVNGSQITAFSTGTAPTQNNASAFNVASTVHTIGRYNPATSNYLGAYLSEIYFVDGQQLTASSFGTTDPQTGVWVPVAYTGTYGTNGFYINFKDNTSTTTLGYDYSGNGNNWTTNNFSVSPGSGNDSLTDVPTPWLPYNTAGDIGGVVRGNYCTLNPLAKTTTSVAPTNGNLEVTTATTGGSPVFGTLAIPASGKWYWEVVWSSGTGNAEIGISAYYPTAAAASDFLDSFALALSYYSVNGNKILNTANTSYGASYTTNDVIGVAVDVDGGTVTFYKNNVSQGAITYSSAGLFPAASDGTSSAASTLIFNFGQRPFAYTPPSGYKSICTTNLPTPTIGATSTTQANDYFDIALYTTTGSDVTINSISFDPGFIWDKNRSAAQDHFLFNEVVGWDKYLSSNSTAAEATSSTFLKSVDAGSIVRGAATAGTSRVMWAWQANGAGSSNTQGSITSTVSANTTAGFSVVTYTGTGATATVGHGLGVAPSMIIIKKRSDITNWPIYHVSTGATKIMVLNLTNAQEVNSAYWNDTAPTSSVFTVKTADGVNANLSTYVAYCFAAVAGYSAFGSYTGNGSTDGPFVYLGFRPAYVLIKYSSSTADWIVLDKSRPGYNVIGGNLYPNAASAEDTQTKLDFTSNGFKIRADGTNANVNVSSGTYIYAAFAESPFKFANAR